MIKNSLFIAFVFSFIFLGLAFTASAQIGDYTEAQIEDYKIKAKDQVQFLAYMLNTLGNHHTSPRDKDVIIRESYKKIFRDEKVQVEDDLSENRTVITNKDITAYLKDIEFFFTQVKFEFDIKDIEAFTRENGELSIKVAFNRTLKATGLEGEVILNTKPRFIEINLDKTTDALAIASIYTTKVSRDVALKQWWKTLSYGWKEMFREKFAITSDSVTLPMLNKIAALDSINISGNTDIVSVAPLTMLVDLKHINISNTRIKDVSALSSLNELVSLNISNTAIDDISYLRYAENIENLNIAYTRITSLEPLQNLQQLKSLSIAGSNVNEFTILKFFTQLQTLDLSETYFGQPSILEDLKQLKSLNLSRTAIYSLSNPMNPNLLETLDISFTYIRDISSLANYTSLNTLNISNTQVTDLTSLEGIAALEKVYADNTYITENKVADFKDKRPAVTLVFNSEALSAWWMSLNPEWQNALKTFIPTLKNQTPTKEQLAKLVSVDSLNLAGKGLTDIAPLKKFIRLRILDISENAISNFDELKGLASLIKLNVKHTGFTHVAPVIGLKKLQVLDISDNNLTSEQVLKLARIKNLMHLNIDNTGTKKQTISQFKDQIDNDCIVIFDTEGLNDWWSKLDNTWQEILQLQVKVSEIPTTQELHQLTALKQILIVDEAIIDLYPLEKFLQLESVYLEKVGLINLESLIVLGLIKSLTIKFSAIASLASIDPMNSITALNLNYTAVEDLTPLTNLNKLQHLSLAGSKIDDLKGLDELYSLQTLDISSTQVKRLKHLSNLNLTQLICFNTRISNREIDNFKADHPNCEIQYY